MKNLAIIPARGGSKRIPRKNIKDFLGKPIIAYSIEAALKSGLFEEVMVSTDDEEIAEIAIQYGAKVPFIRSNDTANDTATLSDVIEEVKKMYLKNDIYFDNICCILPTAPLLKIKTLKKGLDILIETGADSVGPLIRFSYPIQRAVKLIDGKSIMAYPEYRKTRTQDLESMYHDAAQFYWLKFETAMIGDKKYGFEIPSFEAQDIDNMEDWDLAVYKYKNTKDS